ncbi:MAG: hypothetical protein HY260_02555 [Chloroflexi bacterium]|nr:hypothetical protein [Chloroflexota bacterium]
MHYPQQRLERRAGPQHARADRQRPDRADHRSDVGRGQSSADHRPRVGGKRPRPKLARRGRGLGGRYPANLLIGQIASVRKRTQDVFQEADIRPLNNFGALEIVLVLTNFKPVNVAPILGTPAP